MTDAEHAHVSTTHYNLYRAISAQICFVSFVLLLCIWVWIGVCVSETDRGFVKRGRRGSIPHSSRLLVRSMARKRKSEATGLDEADRTLYSTFCAAANSLSQLYTQAMNQQKLAFQAGERHALEKLYQWIVRKHEEGSRITVSDIVTHIQSEMDYTGEDALITPRSPFQHQHQQTTMHIANSGVQPPSGLFGQPTVGLAPRSGHADQVKNSVFSNALSSPVRRSLQPYQLAQGSGFFPNADLQTGNAGARNQDSNQNREANSLSSNDSSMDNAESPPHESY